MNRNTPSNYGRQEEPRLGLFLKEIAKYKPLTRDEELALSLRIMDGDEEAENLLVNSNLRFLVLVAKEFKSYGLSLSDLIAEGVIGLKIAAKKFDGRRGLKFISYGVWFVRQRMQLAGKNNKTVKIPINKQHTIRKVNQAVRDLQQKLHRDPTAGEIAEYLDIDEMIVLDCLNRLKDVILIYEKLHSEGLGKTLADQDADIRRQQDENSDSQIWLNLVNSLPKRQALIIKRYYGVGGSEKMTLEEIAEMMNLSKERVRQLKSIALKVLSKRAPKYLAKHGIFR